MYRKYHGFLHLFASRSQSKPTKNTGIYSVLTRQHAKKHDVFGQFFTLFQPMLLRSKNVFFFTLFLPPLIRTQEGVKSGQIAKLHLNSTFCLSQSLPQSCNTKNYRRLSGASKCCELRCFMKVPCILPAKKGPPPAKADCVSASGKTRPFAPTLRADFVFVHRVVPFPSLCCFFTWIVSGADRTEGPSDRNAQREPVSCMWRFDFGSFKSFWQICWIFLCQDGITNIRSFSQQLACSKQHAETYVVTCCSFSICRA